MSSIGLDRMQVLTLGSIATESCIILNAVIQSLLHGFLVTLDNISVSVAIWQVFVVVGVTQFVENYSTLIFVHMVDVWQCIEYSTERTRNTKNNV